MTSMLGALNHESGKNIPQMTIPAKRGPGPNSTADSSKIGHVSHGSGFSSVGFNEKVPGKTRVLPLRNNDL